MDDYPFMNHTTAALSHLQAAKEALDAAYAVSFDAHEEVRNTKDKLVYQSVVSAMDQVKTASRQVEMVTHDLKALNRHIMPKTVN